ncbi:MAG: c-type cytochrome [Pseudomonadota bacterium]|nr:c-type cytochrome [Pseudomonadota bacterium]
MKSKHRGFGRGSLLGLLALLLVLTGGAVLGPELLGYYRFSEAVKTMSAADAAQGGAWPQLHQVCMPCHGNSGDSVNPHYPDLAGLPAEYFVQQMDAFARGERANPKMSPLAAMLSAEEIRRLAEYFAAQPALANAGFQPDPAQQQTGATLVRRGGCAACHGADFAGQRSFPRLAGQGFDYLVRQLQAYRDGARPDPSGAMPAMSAALSDEDIAAIAQYLASHSTTVAAVGPADGHPSAAPELTGDSHEH